MYVGKPVKGGVAWYAALIGVMFFGGCGAAFGPDGGDGVRSTLNLSTLGLDSDSTYFETASNDLLELAEAVEVSAEPRVIRGRISDERDVDVYDLGPVVPGDRIVVTMTTEESLDGAIVLFDDAGASLLVNDHRNVYLGEAAPYIDVVVRRPSSACFVAVSATPGFNASGDYGLVASREYPVDAPQPRPDVVLLVFDEAHGVRIGGRAPVDVPAFDAANIAASYAGQTAALVAEIVAAVRDDFDGFDVTILSTSEDSSFDGEMTRIYFGTFNQALLGVAEGVDEFNAVPAQQAIIFTDTFQAFMALDPSTAEMARAIGNVASHEIGHLLGLIHTSDPHGIMDVTAGLRELLQDQRFRKSPIQAAVFPLGEQDAVQSLLDSVGGDATYLFSTMAFSDPDVLRARIDSDEPPARGEFYLSSCGLGTH